MKKIYRISGAFFLISVLIFGGCKSSAAQWSHLYQTDGDEEAVSLETEGIGTEDETQGTQEEVNETENIEAAVWVYVCGAVADPGVYELPEGARVIQAIEAAGGLTEDADLLLVNQARIVEDGEQIRIYTKEEVESAELQVNTETGIDKDGKVDLNQASADQLMTLPGIGEAKADAIISYREEHGAFQSIEDIMNIPGIKEAVFSKIRDKITV